MVDFLNGQLLFGGNISRFFDRHLFFDSLARPCWKRQTAKMSLTKMMDMVVRDGDGS